MPNWERLNEPQLREEIDRHRRDHTYGTHIWFPEPKPRTAKLTAEEILEEAEWALGGGVHPLMIAQNLRMKAPNIYRAAVRLDNQTVKVAFGMYSSTSRLKLAS